MSIALGMWFTIVMFATWLSPKTRRKLVGLGWITDLCVHITLQYFFGGTGEERVGLLFGGALINVTMHLYKRWYGWETLSGVRYAGSRTE